MTIKSINLNAPGMVGVQPQIIYLDTDNTLEEVLTPGFLNQAAGSGTQFNDKMVACVTTVNRESGAVAQVVLLDVDYENGNWSLNYPETAQQHKRYYIGYNDFLAIKDNPARLLPELPASQYYVVDFVSVSYLPDGSPFSAGGDVGVQYGNTASLAGQLASGTIPPATFTTVGGGVSSVTGGVSAAPLADTIGKGIYLSYDTSAFTGGSGMVIVDIWYRIVSVA